MSSSVARIGAHKPNRSIAGRPVRTLATVYLFFALLDLVAWAANAGSVTASASLYLYWTWAMYAASLVAIVAVALNVSILSKRLWIFVTGSYLLTRSLELLQIGIPLTQDTSTNVYLILRFVWIAGMPALAMLLLATYNSKNRRQTQLQPSQSTASIEPNPKRIAWDNWLP